MASENVFVTQATIGLIGSGLLQWFKHAKWMPFITEHSAVFNHSILLLTSAVGAVGVHATWNATEHSLVITGLSIGTIAAGIWLWSKQWAVQFLVHRGVFGPVATPATPEITPAKPGEILLPGEEP
jgi:hypothetical protein